MGGVQLVEEGAGVVVEVVVVVVVVVLVLVEEVPTAFVTVFRVLNSLSELGCPDELEEEEEDEEMETVLLGQSEEPDKSDGQELPAGMRPMSALLSSSSSPLVTINKGFSPKRIELEESDGLIVERDVVGGTVVVVVVVVVGVVGEGASVLVVGISVRIERMKGKNE